MSLQGKVVYVAGGSGIVGWGIAEAFLKAGAKVYISSRDQKKLDNIKKKLPENLKERLVGIKGSASDEKDIVAIKDAILAQDKKIDHVVSAIGGWWQKGTLSNQSMQEFNSSITTLVVSHFLVYRTFSKELAKQPRSTYTFVTGGAGELYQKDDFVMLPDASLMFVGGGATYGLYNAAKAEYHTHPNLNINQLRIFVWVRPQEDCTFDPEIATNEVGHDYIGRYAVRIAEKHHAGLVRVKPRDQQNEDDYKKI